MKWGPESLRGLPKVTQSGDWKPAWLLANVLSTAPSSCLREPNMILISKMAITLHSFYKGIQPLIENLKTNAWKWNKLQKFFTAENKKKHASLVLWTHHRSPQSAARQHSVWEAQALQLHKQGFNLTGHLTSSTLFPPPCWVGSATLLCGWKGKTWSSVYSVNPGQMLVPFPFAFTENAIRGPRKQFFNDNCLCLKESRS